MSSWFKKLLWKNCFAHSRSFSNVIKTTISSKYAQYTFHFLGNVYIQSCVRNLQYTCVSKIYIPRSFNPNGQIWRPHLSTPSHDRGPNNFCSIHLFTKNRKTGYGILKRIRNSYPSLESIEGPTPLFISLKWTNSNIHGLVRYCGLIFFLGRGSFLFLDLSVDSASTILSNAIYFLFK